MFLDLAFLAATIASLIIPSALLFTLFVGKKYGELVKEHFIELVSWSIAAPTSFVIVFVALHFSRIPKNNGVLELKFFDLEFSGPSGPITLWSLCFIVQVAGIALIRKR